MIDRYIYLLPMQKFKNEIIVDSVVFVSLYTPSRKRIKQGLRSDHKNKKPKVAPWGWEWD